VVASVGSEDRPNAAQRQSTTERIDVDVEGARVRSVRASRATSAMGANTPTARVTHAAVVRSRVHAGPTEARPPIAVLGPPVLPAPGDRPVASASPGLADSPSSPGSSNGPDAPSTKSVGGGGDGAEFSAPSAGPDIGVFVERLRRSAQRCSLRRGAPGTAAPLARVRFCVDAHGMPQAVSLLQSTGDPRLDRDALECVVPGAAPLPASDRCLVVPLRFSL
jgi:TonB family protein